MLYNKHLYYIHLPLEELNLSVCNFGFYNPGGKLVMASHLIKFKNCASFLIKRDEDLFTDALNTNVIYNVMNNDECLKMFINIYE